MRTGHGGIRYNTNYEEVVPIGLVSSHQVFTVIIITENGRCAITIDNAKMLDNINFICYVNYLCFLTQDIVKFNSQQI